MTQKELLVGCLDLIYKKRPCPETNIFDWAKTLLHLHKNGMLYAVAKEGKVILCAAAYRIKEWDEKYSDVIPEKEDGDIAYSPFSASDSDDRFLLLKVVRQYLKDNPEVKEMIFFNRNSDQDLRRFKIRRKENGQVQESECSKRAIVSA